MDVMWYPWLQVYNRFAREQQNSLCGCVICAGLMCFCCLLQGRFETFLSELEKQKKDKMDEVSFVFLHTLHGRTAFMHP